MTFREFRKNYDKYMGYTEWMSVTEAKEKELIPTKYHKFFKDTCKCGSENMIKNNRSKIRCCNPRCPIKMGYRMADFFKNFNEKGLGPSNCATIYRYMFEYNESLKSIGQKPILETDSFIEIIKLDFNDYPMRLQSLNVGRLLYNSSTSILEKTITFPELISKLGLQSLGSKAINLFDGIDSLDSFMETVERVGGVFKYCISKGSYSASIATDLLSSLPEIYVAGKLFEDSIRMVGLQKIEICMTGRIKLKGSSLTKAEFVSACNDLCKDDTNVQIFEIELNGAKKTAPFILYSAVSTNPKYVEGLARGEITDCFGTHKVLMHTDDFYDMLERTMNKWNNNLKKQMESEKLSESLDNLVSTMTSTTSKTSMTSTLIPEQELQTQSNSTLMQDSEMQGQTQQEQSLQKIQDF